MLPESESSPNKAGPKRADSHQSTPIEGRFVPGKLFAGRYRIVALLGRGGMGEVYRAEDIRLGQTVALKFLPDDLAHDRESMERFYAEVRIGRQVSHPNVCRLYDLIDADGHHCLAMEYVDGEDLSALLKRIGRLPADKATEIARDICAGLGAAHDKGVIHRDLKPANVMIDGKGRARITDFGIAALADDIANAEHAGTPAYMAPEQLEGKPASIRSDIYALGLILFETFAGKPLYRARSQPELLALHSENKTPDLSSSARDIPAAVRQTILRCLEKDPYARPPSAHAVMAALPGGDPLQAALAAGETPSPAMVAAAGRVGDISPALAWTCLLLSLAGLLLIAFLARTTTLVGRLQPDKSPDVLSDKAREILGSFGHGERAGDSARLFRFDHAYLDTVASKKPTSERWNRIAEARPGPLLFVYRQSPTNLVAKEYAKSIFSPTDIGRINETDPPDIVPGMATVVLDRHGWLTQFVRVPSQVDSAEPTHSFDWSPAFVAAGMDQGRFAPTAPAWTAPVDSDFKVAWNGTYASQPDVSIHVEAAAYRGRPVWFTVHGPWVKPTVSTTAPAIAESDRISLWAAIGFCVAMSVPMLAMFRRNLLLGRGDRSGATRLAVFMFLALDLALMLRADHGASLFDETVLLVNVLAQALYFSASMWVAYVAFEPAARRRWPEMVISWSRVLAGRWRDPMVGRDLLFGGLTGIVMILVIHASVLFPTVFLHESRPPIAQVISTLDGSRNQVFYLLLDTHSAVIFGFGNLFGLLVALTIVRRRWLAVGLQFAFAYLFFVSTIASSSLWSPVTALFTAIWFAAMLRFGLWASIVAIYVLFLLYATPMTLDVGVWYSNSMLVSLLSIAAVLVYGFHASLGGKPLFGHLFLERVENS